MLYCQRPAACLDNFCSELPAHHFLCSHVSDVHAVPLSAHVGMSTPSATTPTQIVTAPGSPIYTLHPDPHLALSPHVVIPTPTLTV